MVKYLNELLSGVLADLINISFSSGIYPTLFKFAKVIPIYKAKSSLEVSSYRPISLLQIFDKIFVRLIYKDL